ncbi:MAG: PE family protein [Mycobacterium sp.]|uniref:PE family protein n=1 Tax=Mycobacterium sp. TaxID=1785 RepID=UPI001ED2BBD9|nr:PE family protein [Mycobacterium sp.]MBW0017965.1 PE family protein [Mycobacterium sp.]
MSFVITPEVVSAAVGNVAGIGSTLGEVTAAAAGPTTSVEAAAADEVSAAIAQLFGSYGQQFQALSSQAAAFHADFVSLLSGSAASYLATEIGNAQHVVAGASSIGGAVNAADSILPLPVLGGGGGGGGGLLGILGGGGTGGIFGGLGALFGTGGTGPFGAFGQAVNGALAGFEDGSYATLVETQFAAGLQSLTGGLGSLPGGLQELGSLLSGLFTSPAHPVSVHDPWPALFMNTGANLGALAGDLAAHPFPILQRIAINQAGYAELIGANLANAAANFPGGLALLPGDVQNTMQLAQGFNPGATLQWYNSRQAQYSQVQNTALGNAVQDLGTTLPTFNSDIAQASHELSVGDFHGAVQRLPQAFVDLFLSGIELRNGTDLVIHGPAGDLVPLTAVMQQQTQDMLSQLPQGSTLQHMAQNFVNAENAATGTLGLAVIGPPIATLDGFASGLTEIGFALQSGSPLAIGGAFFDLPAYVLNGLLNGNSVMDLTIPLSETVVIPAIPPILNSPITIGTGTPIVVHMPFEGILAQPQPITATINADVLGIDIPIITTGAGMNSVGLVPALLNYMPLQVAASLTGEPLTSNSIIPV